MSLAFLAFAYLGGITSVGGALVAGTLAPLGIGYVVLDRALDLGEHYLLVSGLLLVATAILNPEGIAGRTRAMVAVGPPAPARAAPPTTAVAPVSRSCTDRSLTTAFDLDQTDRLLTTTRAVRKRLDLTRPVPREVVLECLRSPPRRRRAATASPGAGSSSTTPTCGPAWPSSTARPTGPTSRCRRRSSARPAATTTAPCIRSSDYLADHLHEVPVIVIPCLLDPPARAASPADIAGFYGSILPAAWSFMLALRSRGLGSAYTTLHLHEEAGRRRAARHPRHGHPVRADPGRLHGGDEFKPAERRPVRTSPTSTPGGGRPERRGDGRRSGAHCRRQFWN